MSQQINLFNPVFLKEKKYFSAVTMLQSLAILAVGTAAFYAYANYQISALARRSDDTSAQYRLLQERLVRTTAQFAPKVPDASLATEVGNLQAQLTARQLMIGSLGTGALGKDSGYAEFMRAFARQSVDGLWLTGFRFGEGGEQVEINGRALQPGLVPAFIRRLNQEKVMHGRAFDALVLTQRQAPLPAVPGTKPGTVPVSYAYTEFRLGSTHAQMSAETSEAEPAARAEPDMAPTAAAATPAIAPVLQLPGLGAAK